MQEYNQIYDLLVQIFQNDNKIFEREESSGDLVSQLINIHAVLIRLNSTLDPLAIMCLLMRIPGQETEIDI